MASGTRYTPVEIAQSRSAAYGFLANALRYPDPALLDALGDPEKWSSWPAVLAEVDPEAADALLSVRDRIASVDPDHPEPEAYARLFGHAVRGKCPPYELEYGRAEIIQQASELADITGFYSAFGMELADSGNERADHVAVECEFMSVLAAKQAYAIDNDDPQACEVTCDAQCSFLSDHLGRWLPAFARRTQEANPNGLYGAIAQFAAAFVAAECRRFDAVCGPQFLELRPADPSRDTAIACGPEEACPEGQKSPLVQVGIAPSTTDTKR